MKVIPKFDPLVRVGEALGAGTLGPEVDSGGRSGALGIGKVVFLEVRAIFVLGCVS